MPASRTAPELRGILLVGALVLVVVLGWVSWALAGSAIRPRESGVTASAGVVTAVSDGPSEGSWFWMYTTPKVAMAVPGPAELPEPTPTGTPDDAGHADGAPVKVDFELESAVDGSDPRAVIVLSGAVAAGLRACEKARVERDVSADGLPEFARAAVVGPGGSTSVGGVANVEATYTVIEPVRFRTEERVEPHFTQQRYATRETIVACEFSREVFWTATVDGDVALNLPEVRKAITGAGESGGFNIVGRYMNLEFDGSDVYGESALVPPTRPRDGEIEFRSDARTWSPDVAELVGASVHIAPADREDRRERDLLIAGVLLGVIGALLVSMLKTAALMVLDRRSQND